MGGRQWLILLLNADSTKMNVVIIIVFRLFVFFLKRRKRYKLQLGAHLLTATAFCRLNTTFHEQMLHVWTRKRADVQRRAAMAQVM